MRCEDLRCEEKLKKLEELRCRLTSLRQSSLWHTDEFVQWHGDLCSTIKDFFGGGSYEFSNISSIKPEPPPELLNDGESLLEKMNENIGAENTKHTMLDLCRENFRKRCFDLDDALAACIFKVRTKDK